MAGYAVSSRIAPTAPRARDVPCPRPPAGVVESRPDIVMVDLDGSAARPTAGRWTAVRDRWAQATFYLFDAESWR